MSSTIVFAMLGVLGHLAWLLCFRAYIWPKFRNMDPVEVHRAIATLHSFRFVGLVVLLPGVVGSHFPTSLAVVGARWDLATSALALLALFSVGIRRLFLPLIVAFNLVGAFGLVLTYYHAVQVNMPAIAGEFGAAFVIPVLYMPIQTITHVAAFYLLLRRRYPPRRALHEEMRHA